MRFRSFSSETNNSREELCFLQSLGRQSEGAEKFPADRVPDPDPGAAAGGMGLQARRSASRSPGAAGPRPGVLPLLPPPLLLLLLLCPGACGAAAPGQAEASTPYLWKTGKWHRVLPSSPLHLWVRITKLLGFRRDPCAS